MKTHLQCGRPRLQAEVEIACVDKERIGNHRVAILAEGLPLCKRLSGEADAYAARVIKCRAFLAWRRGAEVHWERMDADGRAGALKMDWTEPPLDAGPMGF
jgi:hypothetical protein